MYAVFGATGNTGRVVVRELLQRGARVRAVVRNAEKAAVLRDRGAEIVVADLSDAARLREALRGVEGAYLMLPPHIESDDVLASLRKLADAMAEAVAAAEVPHVVLLSSIGVQRDAGTGPILGNRYLEQVVRSVAPNVSVLRAPYFMENWGASLGLLGEGKLITMIAPEQSLPMIATVDIGRIAAGALRDPAAGQRILALEGPRDYAPSDVARALAKLLSREVALAFVPSEAIVPALTGAGLRTNMAELYREMYDGIARGIIVHEAGSHERVRGTTPLEAVLRTLVES